MRTSARSTSGFVAASSDSSKGNDSTNCRIGTAGRTSLMSGSIPGVGGVSVTAGAEKVTVSGPLHRQLEDKYLCGPHPLETELAPMLFQARTCNGSANESSASDRDR